MINDVPPETSVIEDLFPLRSFFEQSRVLPRYSTSEHDSDPDIERVASENIFIDYDSRSYVRVMKRMESPKVLSTKKYRSAMDKALKKATKGADNAQKMRTKAFLERYPRDISVDELDEKKFERNTWEERSQSTFFLRCYLPKRVIAKKNATQRIRRLVVMFNGLNETDRFDFYDVVGAQFAEAGMAAVLLPTPYQLNRRIAHEEEPKYLRATDIASKPDKGKLFYYNFKRSWYELRSLIGRIRVPDDRDCGFYENYFTRDTEISLLGFSMGGVRALGTFLMDQMEADRLDKADKEAGRTPEDHRTFHACVTFNSDCDVFSANVTRLFNDSVKPDVMPKIKGDLVDKFYGGTPFPLGRSSADVLAVFKALYLITRDRTVAEAEFGAYVGKPEGTETKDAATGEVRTIWGTERFPLDEAGHHELERVRKAAAEVAPRLLLIQSGADEAFRDAAFRLLEPNSGFHRRAVAGVRHIPTLDKEWDHWIANVGETMVRFIENVREQDFVHKDVRDQLEQLLAPTREYVLLHEQMKKDHHRIGPPPDRPGPDASKDQKKALRAKGVARLEELDRYRRDFEEQDFPPGMMHDMRAQVLAQRDGAEKEKRFLELYYVSKAFYPRFRELLSKILGVGRPFSISRQSKGRLVIVERQVRYARSEEDSTLIRSYMHEQPTAALLDGNDVVVTFDDGSKQRLLGPYYHHPQEIER